MSSTLGAVTPLANSRSHLCCPGRGVYKQKLFLGRSLLQPCPLLRLPRLLWTTLLIDDWSFAAGAALQARAGLVQQPT